MSESIQTHAPSRPSPVVQSRPGAFHISGHRYNKACDSCHISKVRCMPDPQSPIGTCKRCSKNGSSCIFSPVGPRRRPLRTKNDRIAELERRVKDMQIKLEKQVEKRSGTDLQPDASAPRFSSSASSASSAQASGDDPEPPKPTSSSASGVDPRLGPGCSSVNLSPDGAFIAAAASTSRDAVKTTNYATSIRAANDSREKNSNGFQTLPVSPSTFPASTSTLVPASDEKLDVIDRGLLTESQADRLVYEFRSALNGKYLGICLPSATTNLQLRQCRPAFWLSILCAASAGSPELSHLAPVLFSQLETILDVRIVPWAEPDVDALQALMNWAIFHNDPVFPLGEHFAELYSLAIQMAVNMAEASRLHCLPKDAPLAEDEVSQSDIQLSRELLHWYWGSFPLTIKKRQPTMLRHTHLVDASLRILRIAQDQNDARLIQWIKLVQIAAEAVLALHHGHTQNADGLSDDARDGILESFERQRKQWLVDCPFHLVNEPLMLEYHSFVILVSEVIYPAGVADFRQRSYGLPSLLSVGQGDPVPDRDFFAFYKIRYTCKSITAAHACLDLATVPAKSDEINPNLSSLTDLLRRCGSFLHSRIFYALRLLLSVAHEAWRTKRYDVIDIDTLKIDSYIAALRARLETVSDKGRYRVPSLWLNALQAKIEPWWQALRGLLEQDRLAERKRLSAVEHTPMLQSNAVGPPQPESASREVAQQLATRSHWALLDRDAPSSPVVTDTPFELRVANPPSTTSSCNGISGSNGLLDPALTDTGCAPAVTAVSEKSLESGVSPADGTERGLTRSLQEDITDLPPNEAQAHLEVANDCIHDHDAGVNGLDPFTVDWETFSESLPGSELFFPPLSPLVPAEPALKWLGPDVRGDES